MRGRGRDNLRKGEEDDKGERGREREGIYGGEGGRGREFVEGVRWRGRERESTRGDGGRVNGGRD